MPLELSLCLSPSLSHTHTPSGPASQQLILVLRVLANRKAGSPIAPPPATLHRKYSRAEHSRPPAHIPGALPSCGYGIGAKTCCGRHFFHRQGLVDEGSHEYLTPFPPTYDVRKHSSSAQTSVGRTNEGGARVSKLSLILSSLRCR